MPLSARRQTLPPEAYEVIVVGDDILVEPAFLQAHRDFHAERPSLMRGALGLVEWPSDYLEDPYMNWLDRLGLQFGFRGLEPGQQLEYYHFYTANISLKRQALLNLPFDEEFPDAAFEDSDLGARLVEAGFQLYFEPRAAGEHRHFYTLEQSCEHRRRVGQSAKIFERKQPLRARFRWIRRYPAPLRWLAARGWAGQNRYFYWRNSEAFWEGYRGRK